MKKLIALDLDGTLLTWKNDISPRTLEALLEVQRQGHYVMIATGRPFKPSMRFAEKLKLREFGGFVSNYNGGLITKLSTMDVLNDVKFNDELREEIVDYIDSLGVDYSIINDKVMYTNKNGKLLFRIFRKLMGQKPVVERDLHDYTDFPVYKILLNDYKKYLFVTQKKIEEKFAGRIEISMSSPVSIELTPANTSKGKSLLMVADILGVDYSDTIAFGNYGNDKSMIEMAGMGVAMKNSSQELLDLADYVTDTNNDDGIAKYLEEFLLNK